MRYTPAALALSLAALVVSSAGIGAPPQPLEPRAAALVAQGRAEMAAGRINQAIDAFESALAVQPASIVVLLELGRAARAQGMQGKALHYYREALAADPQNLGAIAGEGEALVEKGAVEKARRNLSRLQGLCGQSCEATQKLAAAISRGPAPRMVSAEAVTPAPVITQN